MSNKPEIEEKRKALQLKSEEFGQNLTQEVDSLKHKAVDAGKYALVAAGLAVASLIVAKFIYTMIVGGDYDEESTKSNSQIIHLPSDQQGSFAPLYRGEPKEQSLIMQLIMSAIATFILSIAKQKLTQFLEKIYAKEANKDSKPAA